jgi:hypothetical protein
VLEFASTSATKQTAESMKKCRSMPAKSFNFRMVGKPEVIEALGFFRRLLPACPSSAHNLDSVDEAQCSLQPLAEGKVN